MTGDTGAAIETQRRAIELVPADHAARGQLEKRLAKYEAAVASTSHAESGAP